MTRVFVASDDVGVVGFYTLSMYSVESRALPADVANSLPRYAETPAALIGRLARAQRARGQRVGELLLLDAIQRIVATTDAIAAFAIIVDAKDEHARAFYASFGFQSFPSRLSRMFLPMATAAAVIPRDRSGRSTRR